MTRKSCYKPIKAFIYIEFLANDEDAMGNLITTNLAFRELENEAVETINVFAGLNIQPDEERRLRICVKHGMIIIGVEFSRENMQ